MGRVGLGEGEKNFFSPTRSRPKRGKKFFSPAIYPTVRPREKKFFFPSASGWEKFFPDTIIKIFPLLQDEGGDFFQTPS